MKKKLIKLAIFYIKRRMLGSHEYHAVKYRLKEKYQVDTSIYEKIFQND